MKILILKPSSLGDVVQALPVLRLLRRHLPASEIYWWIESGLAPLLSEDGDLTGIIPFERRRWAAPRNWLGLWRNVQWVRRQGFDWVIDLQSLARSAAFAWLANGRLTIGLDDPREGATAFYDLAVPRPSASTHAVDWYLSVLPLLGVPVSREFQWLPPRPKVASALACSWPVASARWIVLQPGARWLNKRWPVESFAALARQCGTLGPDFRVAVLGAKEDAPLAKAMVTTDRCLDLTGKLSLPEMVEWMRCSELVITNDTGPMHVAAALGKPVVALFGPTDPRRTGPYGQLDHVLKLDLPCAPCLSSRCRSAKPFECLRSLPVDLVFETVKERLNGLRGSAQ